MPGKPYHPAACRKRKRVIEAIDHEHVVCLSKRRYPDESTARAFGMRALARPDNPQNALYVYRCVICGGWHLTKQGARNGVQRIVLRMRAAL